MTEPDTLPDPPSLAEQPAAEPEGQVAAVLAEAVGNAAAAQADAMDTEQAAPAEMAPEVKLEPAEPKAEPVKLEVTANGVTGAAQVCSLHKAVAFSLRPTTLCKYIEARVSGWWP